MFFRKEKKEQPMLSDETFNVVVSIAKAKTLYKELIFLAHPDKHQTKIVIATELTSLITRNKFNYRELLMLKERVKKELY